MDWFRNALFCIVFFAVVPADPVIRRKKHWEMMKEMVHHQVLCMCNMMRDPKESNKSVAPVAKRGRKAAGQGGGGMRS
ncbi:unnamed protein product [Prunus armeniaca]|uniref:Uncharacterized protein n=1 Tax=Prunus armeniaca TaxID=36596 RepID=A0A6J5X9F2_PRUAR|nr:unnamed protein product [Prunus armeniaca]